MNPAVSVRELRKSYGDVEAVRGVSFDIGVGECFGLLGPNGAGKTTTVEILEGLRAPGAGSVEVLGEHWGAGRDRQLRERLGVCLQETMLSPKLQVGETLDLFRALYRCGRAPGEVMAEVALTEKAGARVGTLSGGQKQRLALACALVGDPELLFLDEPTTGLDPQSRRQVWEIVGRFKERGGTVLLTTHYMEEAERLCDRLAVVDHGVVIAGGSPAELVRELGGDHVVEVTLESGEPPSLDELASLPGVRRAQGEGDRLVFTVAEPHRSIAALLERLAAGGVVLSQLSTRHASLEDVFLTLTGRHLRDD